MFRLPGGPRVPPDVQSGPLIGRAGGRSTGMRTQTSGRGLVRDTKTRALAAALMLTALMAMSVLAPAPARASAFPGANGKIVFSSDRTTGTGVNNPEGDLEIFSMNPDGTALKQLTKNNTDDTAPSYSPNGKRLVFMGQRTGNFDVFSMNVDGTGQKNLTKNPARDLRPSFSPDGKKILFDSDRNSTPFDGDVFVMSADGTGLKQLTTGPEEDADATFSPKGDKIAFVSRRVDPQGFADGDIFTMNPDGTQQTRLTNNSSEDNNPSFSPDGNKMAFTSDRFGGTNPEDFDILVMDSNGANPTNFTASRATDDEPAFSPDGKKIAFVSTRDGDDGDVFVMDASNGANQTDVTPNDRTESSLDWQPTAATFTVNTASDTGNGACDGTCTLREAIDASNAVQGQIPNTIRFNISGSGVQTITPTTNLPAITRPVIIDGYTQPGSSPNTLAAGTNATLKIELNGTNTFGSGLQLNTSDSVIRGLVINRFGSSEIGIFNFSSAEGTADNRIEGNFLGTDPTGTLGRSIKGTGVQIDGGSGNVVGGTTPASRNLISGNDEGIELSSGAHGNRVLGNLIGTTASGTAPLGNDFWGVAMFDSFTSNNRIGDGTAAGSNTIAFNKLDGIEVDFPGTATGNQISRNSIFSNGGLGIDLIGGIETDNTDVPTPNDAGDTDAGPNNLQNKPVLTSAKTSSTKTTIVGKLNSTPAKTFKIEFFSNPSSTNEGKKFVGQKSVATDASGNATFSFSPAAKVPVGQTITATATDPGGNTSEFSAPRTVATS
jgi:CSLREA domain-containing protein